MANIVYRFIEDKPKQDKPKGQRGPAKGEGGAPSKKDVVDLYMIECLYSFGLIDEQIAKALDISEATLNAWKKDENFLKALRKGKQVADERVVQALYQRAIGFTHADQDIRVVNGVLTKTDIIKKYPPDTMACQFWLKNRRKDEWKDKHEVGLSDGQGGPAIFKVVYEDGKKPSQETQEEGLQS